MWEGQISQISGYIGSVMHMKCMTVNITYMTKLDKAYTYNFDHGSISCYL